MKPLKITNGKHVVGLLFAPDSIHDDAVLKGRVTATLLESFPLTMDKPFGYSGFLERVLIQRCHTNGKSDLYLFHGKELAEMNEIGGWAYVPLR